MPRYRVEYSKTDKARWLSHLELIRTFIRALRRSGLPLVLSQGFNPHPRISYGPSLGVGVAGLREYLDVDLATTIPLSNSLSSLRQQFPQGLEIRRLMELPPSAPGIGKAVNCAWYRLDLPPEQATAFWQQALDRLIGDPLPLYYKRPKDGRLFDVRLALAACRITEVGSKRSEVGVKSQSQQRRHDKNPLASDFRLRPEFTRHRAESEADYSLEAQVDAIADRAASHCIECCATPDTKKIYSLSTGPPAAVIDLLVDVGSGAVPLRGLVETLLSLTGAAGCFEPYRVTRVALLYHNGGLVNPLGERKQLWET